MPQSAKETDLANKRDLFVTQVKSRKMAARQKHQISVCVITI